MKAPTSDTAPMAIQRRLALGLRINSPNGSMAGTRKMDPIPRPVGSHILQDELVWASAIIAAEKLAVTYAPTPIRIQRIREVGRWNKIVPAVYRQNPATTISTNVIHHSVKKRRGINAT